MIERANTQERYGNPLINQRSDAGAKPGVTAPSSRLSAADLARAEWEGMVATPDDEGLEASHRQMPTLHQVAMVMAERDCAVACVVDGKGKLVGVVTNLEIVHGPLAEKETQVRGDDSVRWTLQRLRGRDLCRVAVVDDAFPHLAVMLDPQSSTSPTRSAPCTGDSMAEISGHRTIWIRLP